MNQIQQEDRADLAVSIFIAWIEKKEPEFLREDEIEKAAQLSWTAARIFQAEGSS